jgi:exodeoxyribonuclease VII large subunit
LLQARLARTGDRIQVAMDRHIRSPRTSLDRMAVQLDALSPLKVLARGYSVARLANGTVAHQTAQLPPGTRFSLRVSDGELMARSEET